MCIKRERTFLIETVVLGVTGGNKSGQLNFQPQYQLQNLEHKSIEIYTATDIPTSPQGNGVATAAQLAATTLTLYINDPKNINAEGQFIQLMPAMDFHYLQNASNETFSRMRFEFEKGITVVWEKSYLQFSVPYNNAAGTNIAVLLNVDYANVVINPDKAKP